MALDNEHQHLFDHLFAKNRGAVTAPEALVATIADSRTAIAELDAISSVLTGEPSMLKAQTDQLLACDECLALLDAYVEEWMSGVDVAERYPKVVAHLASCSDCQEQANLMYELLGVERQRVEVTPTYMSFEAWFQQQGAGNVTAEGSPFIENWKQITERAYRLSAEIHIMIEGAKAVFGALAGGLTPQLAPATVYRSTPVARGGFAEFLELPHAAANLAVKVRLGPVVEKTGTLVIEIDTLTPPQPIAHARVILRDGEGGLLEAAQSDADGLVIFGHLEVGKYGVQVEYADQTWNFAVTLSAA